MPAKRFNEADIDFDSIEGAHSDAKRPVIPIQSGQ